MRVMICSMTLMYFVAASFALAQEPPRRPDRPTRPEPRSARPQTGNNRLPGQANGRNPSPAPGKGGVGERPMPDRRGRDDRPGANDRRGPSNTPDRDARPDRSRDGRPDAGQGPNERPQGRPGPDGQRPPMDGRPDGERPEQDGPNRGPGRRGPDPRSAGTESPRQALERGFRNRLSQIDRLRDRALDTGNLDLLDVADRMELDARRKYSELRDRLSDRQNNGQPNVGPPVRVSDGRATPNTNRPLPPRPAGNFQPQSGQTQPGQFQPAGQPPRPGQRPPAGQQPPANQPPVTLPNVDE